MAPNIKVLIVVFTMFIWFLACVISLFLEVVVHIVPQGTTTGVFIFFLIVVLVEFFFLFILPMIIR